MEAGSWERAERIWQRVSLGRSKRGVRWWGINNQMRKWGNKSSIQVSKSSEWWCHVAVKVASSCCFCSPCRKCKGRPPGVSFTGSGVRIWVARWPPTLSGVDVAICFDKRACWVKYFNEVVGWEKLLGPVILLVFSLKGKRQEKKGKSKRHFRVKGSHKSPFRSTVHTVVQH